jgi:hypothetical protein
MVRYPGSSNQWGRLSDLLLLSAAAYAGKPTDPSDGQLYRGDGKVQAWSASTAQ